MWWSSWRLLWPFDAIPPRTSAPLSARSILISDLFRNPPTESVDISNDESRLTDQSSQRNRWLSSAKSLIRATESVPFTSPVTRIPAQPASPETLMIREELPLEFKINSPAEICPEQRKSKSKCSLSIVIDLHTLEMECMNERPISLLSSITESSPDENIIGSALGISSTLVG